MTTADTPGQKHRNDIYNDAVDQNDAGTDAIPAATVVLLRETAGPEVLMLHKTSNIAFGGMWVFPGGRIDPGDYAADGDLQTAARNAAVRETREEAGIAAKPDDFVWFAHWTPPASTPRRFATWFFAAPVTAHDVIIDGGEIQDHQWLKPAEALARHAAGEIDLAPPTWITLHQLAAYSTRDAALQRLGESEPKIYRTRIGKRADGARVAMWRGDAGYDAWDATAQGARHRLVMAATGFEFENDAEVY